MPSMMKPVLFVVHEASRGGAPLIILGIIREFKKQSHIPFKILIVEDGELSNDFKALGPTFIWFKEPRLKRQNTKWMLARLIRRLQQSVRSLIILSKLKGTAVVLLNTIANGHIQNKLLRLQAKFICYVHEMETSIRMLTSDYTMDITKKHTNLFLAGSNAVKLNLITAHNIPPENIKVVYSSLSPVYQDKSDYKDVGLNFKRQHNIPCDHIIVGIASSAEWRKGFDWLFPLMAVYFSLFPGSPVTFVWKGYRPKSDNGYTDLYDFKKAALLDRLVLLPHGKDSIDIISTFDIHLLLSREDPYPLVVLEAASFAIPTIAFQDAGGTPEFLEADAGISVKYGDLPGMANAIHALVSNQGLRMELGLKAQEKVGSRHNQADAAREVIEVIESEMR